MNTSYFSKSANHPQAVSIAHKTPPYFTGRHFKILAPPKWLYKKFKKDLDVKEFTKNYNKEVLNKLNPKEIYNQLGENAVLLCWEGKDKFCHRFICAKWFYKMLGIKITEL
jgi:hypothetical protein